MLWKDALDRVLEWTHPGALPGRDSGAILEAGGLLYRTCAARLLGCTMEKDDREELCQWLEKVTIQPEIGLGPQRKDVDGIREWPILRARRRESPLPEPYETLFSTALVQFLGHWRDSLVSAIYRCHGVRRGTPEKRWLPQEWEEEFARRAKLLDLLRIGNLHQCPRIVWSDRASRFCSKACSNASFAARKAIDEPRYFAEKQERYRTRQQQIKKPRRDPGAFVYMD